MVDVPPGPDDEGTEETADPKPGQRVVQRFYETWVRGEQQPRRRRPPPRFGGVVDEALGQDARGPEPGRASIRRSIHMR